ncbi:hypothetical protein AB0J83_31585 [Actinoplanes sp. NPDC049596]|uniref:hypothetical protein n=1 Tax=unclassified Actinoplanes TaxID=2626549 RepID=UPI0034386F81
MSQQPDQTQDQPIERGAAEDASGVPVTPTDIEASRKPPIEPRDPQARPQTDRDAD